VGSLSSLLQTANQNQKKKHEVCDRARVERGKKWTVGKKGGENLGGKRLNPKEEKKAWENNPRQKPEAPRMAGGEEWREYGGEGGQSKRKQSNGKARHPKTEG